MPRSYGTHVLLESARLYGKIKRFINVSTDEVYGETSLGKEEGLTEASTLEPTNPYSAAKAGAEMMARAYHTSYKLPVIVTRGNNVYGPHQFPEKVRAAAGSMERWVQAAAAALLRPSAAQPSAKPSL